MRWRFALLIDFVSQSVKKDAINPSKHNEKIKHFQLTEHIRDKGFLLVCPVDVQISQSLIFRWNIHHNYKKNVQNIVISTTDELCHTVFRF